MANAIERLTEEAKKLFRRGERTSTTSSGSESSTSTSESESTTRSEQHDEQNQARSEAASQNVGVKVKEHLENIRNYKAKRAEIFAELKTASPEAKMVLVKKLERIEHHLIKEMDGAKHVVPGLRREVEDIIKKNNESIAQTKDAIENEKPIPPLDFSAEKQKAADVLATSNPMEQLRGEIIQEKVEQFENDHEVLQYMESGKVNIEAAARQPRITPEEIEAQIRAEASKVPPPKPENTSQEDWEKYLAENGYEGFGLKFQRDNLRSKMMIQGAAMQGLADPMTAESQGYVLPPKLEGEGGIGEAGIREWFLKGIQDLEEKYSDQSFESNWRVIYPLEQFLMLVKDKADKVGDSFVDPITHELGSYNKLRSELFNHLESRRARHNASYVFSHIPGIGDAIPAGDMLKTKKVNFLLRIPGVAEEFRNLEAYGNELKAARAKLERLEHTSRHTHGKAEKDKADAKVGVQNARIREIQVEMSKLRDKNYKGQIAGGLWSLLDESARFDSQINDSGDFYTNRVKNFPARARGFIRAHYPKNSLFTIDDQDKLVDIIAPTMDLRVKGFFERSLEEYKKKLEEKDKSTAGEKFREFCQQKNIRFFEKEGQDGEHKKEVDAAKAKLLDVDIDLSQTKFEELNFSQYDEKDENGNIINPALGLPDNETRLRRVDFSDADGVRKFGWDPGTYLHQMSSANINRMFLKILHIKGEEKVEFTKGVINGLIEANKDDSVPVPVVGGIIRKTPLVPFFLRDSLLKRARGIEPHTRADVEAMLKFALYSGMIQREEYEEMEHHHLGPSWLLALTSDDAKYWYSGILKLIGKTAGALNSGKPQSVDGGHH